MTVDELRKALEGLPGDIPVKVSTQSGFVVANTAYTQDIYKPRDGVLTKTEEIFAFVIDPDYYD